MGVKGWSLFCEPTTMPTTASVFRATLAVTLLSSAAHAQDAKSAPQSAPAPQAAPVATPAPAPAPAVTPAAAVAVTPAVAPAKTEAPQDFARIICFRAKKFAGALLHFTVCMDEKDVADLNNGTYFVIKATPGEHSFYADEKKDAFTMKIEAGKTYYFGSEVVMGFWKGNGRLVAMDEGVGAKTFEGLKAKLTYSPELRDPAILEIPGTTSVPAVASASTPVATPAASAPAAAPASAPAAPPAATPAVAPVSAPVQTPAAAPAAAPAAQ